LVHKKNMQTQYSLDMAGKIYRVEFYELRGANLQQLLEANTNSKLIKNAKNLDLNTLKMARSKDKFLGSILVEFE
ncbi:deacylase, partial [Campylobacter jejuni]